MVDGARPSRRSDRPHAQPGLTQIGDLDALVLGQVARADLTDRQPIQRRDEPDHHTVAIDLVPTRPVRPRGPGNTDFAGRGPHTPPPSPQLHEPLTLGRLRTTPRPLLHPTRRCQHNLQNLEKVLRPHLETTRESPAHFSTGTDSWPVGRTGRRLGATCAEPVARPTGLRQVLTAAGVVRSDDFLRY